MFVKLRWTDKKKTLLYPKEMMKWIRIGLNKESKSWRAKCLTDMQARNAPLRWSFWTGIEPWYLFVKVIEFNHNYKAQNICVITALNVSSEKMEINWKLHVVAGLGSDVIS